jgi:catalase
MTGQMLIHANNAPYSPNTLNTGHPKQATQSSGKGFFTAPERTVSGKLVRATRKSFLKDYWSQPRLFFNSLVPQEQQFIVNAIRFETSHLKSHRVKENILAQLNKIHSRVAKEVAEVLGMNVPGTDTSFHHSRTTKDVSVFGNPLHKIAGLKVGVLVTEKSLDSKTVQHLKSELGRDGVSVVVVAETLKQGVDQTYSTTDATDFDALVVGNGATPLLSHAVRSRSSLFPAGRPLEILQDAYRYGKPVGFAGDSSAALDTSRIQPGPGVYIEDQSFERATGNFTFSNHTLSKRDGQAEEAAGNLAHKIREGLHTFKFLNRFPVEHD